MPLNNPVSEKIEYLEFANAIQTSNDLEAATKTINAVAEPGVADYSWTGGVTAPTDSRIVVQRICARLQITIDSFGGGGAVLNYRIKKGGVSIGTGQISTGAATGARYAAHDITAAPLTGNALYEVFLWVDAGNCVVSVAQLWVACGSCENAAWQGAKIFTVNHTGRLWIGHSLRQQGSGTIQLGVWLQNSTVLWNTVLHYYSGAAAPIPANLTSRQEFNVTGGVDAYVGALTVATDLVYAAPWSFILRSEQ